MQFLLTVSHPEVSCAHLALSTPPPQPAHSAPSQVLPMYLSPDHGYFSKCQSRQAQGWGTALLACLDGDMGQCTWI